MLPEIHVKPAFVSYLNGEILLPVEVVNPQAEAWEVGMRCACCNRIMELFERYTDHAGQKHLVILRCAKCRWATEY